MIFDFFAPSQGRRGRRPKNCTVACAIHVSNSRTKSGCISLKTFLTPNLHGKPKSNSWGMTQAVEWNPVWYVLYLSFVRRHTNFGLKIFEIDFAIEI